MLDESFPRTRASEARQNELSGNPNSGVMGGGGGRADAQQFTL